MVPSRRSSTFFKTRVPVRQRLVHHGQHGHAADVGIGVLAQAQLGAQRRDADVDREREQPLQDLHKALLGVSGTGDDQEVDAGIAAEVRQLLEVAELGIAADAVGGALVEAVVEDAEDGELLHLVVLEGGDQLLGLRSAADDHRAAHEAAGRGPVRDRPRHGEASHDHQQNRECEPGDTDDRREDLKAREITGAGTQAEKQEQRLHDALDLRRGVAERGDGVGPVAAQ